MQRNLINDITADINMNKMKLLIYAFIIVCVGTTARAQQHFPTPADNPFWMLEHGQLYQHDCTPGCGYYTSCMLPLYYGSDTVISTTNYHRLFKRSVCHSMLTSPSPYCIFSCDFNIPEEPYAIIYVDTVANKVYLYSEYDGGTHLLYDFNLSVGQLYPPTFNNPYNPSSDSLMVLSEDSVLLGNTYHKKWNLGVKTSGSIHDSAFVSIIEGVGSTYGITADLVTPFETSDALICFSIAGTVLYPDSASACDQTIGLSETAARPSFEIYPNPAQNMIQLNLIYSENEIPVSLFNAHGQKISRQIISGNSATLNVSMLPSGLYFIRIDSGRNAGVKGFLKE
jgi:hypothetical protein